MNYLRRAAARTQAQAMINLLESEKPGAAARLATGPMTELRQWENLEIHEVPEDQTAGGCSVAGAYFSGPPPVLAVARSTSLARRDFTALHELGHHLQQTKLELMDVLLDEPDRGTLLEDTACDAFAAAILLPEALTDLHLGSRGPTAGETVGLWQASRASRMAVCVKASERLPAPGHVLLLDSSGRVVFAASYGLPPLRRGSDQSDIPVIRNALSSPDGRVQGRSRVLYRDRILGDELYAQTSAMDGYVLAILVTDRAPWKTFAPPAPQPGPNASEWTCEHCGEDFTSFAPACERCHTPRCPACGRCGCASHAAERRCHGCSMIYPATMFEPGSERCHDCS